MMKKTVEKVIAKKNEDPDTLKELDLDIFNVLKNMFADKFSTAIDNHTRSAKENVDFIEKALDDKDASGLELAAHSLKGASAQFGAFALSDLARQTEMLAKEGNFEQAVEIYSALKQARETAQALMEAELKTK